MELNDTTIDNVYNPKSNINNIKHLSILSNKLYTIVIIIIVLIIIIILTNRNKRVRINNDPEIIVRDDPRTRQSEIKKTINIIS